MDPIQYISMYDVCVFIYTDLVDGVSSTGFCQRNCLLQLWLIPSSETEDRMMLYWVVSSEWWLLALSLYSPWFVLPDSHVSDGLTGDHLSPPPPLPTLIPTYILSISTTSVQMLHVTTSHCTVLCTAPIQHLQSFHGNKSFITLKVLIYKSFENKLNVNFFPYIFPLHFFEKAFGTK